jgi:glycosyltransferase involved in cell wall biosynthesis
MSKSTARPLVTALINTYNYGRFVEEAIESALAQDYPRERMEVLVVDDGSTDDTPERIEKFGGRIEYHRLPHAGQGAALDFGLRRARGEIVCLLDADDVWKPQKVRRVVEAFAACPEAVMVYHAIEYLATHGRETPLQPFQAISGKIYEQVHDLLRIDGQATSGLAFRRSTWEKMLPLSPDFVIGCSDGYMAFNSFFLGPVVALDEPLTQYRLHGENLFSFTAADPAKRQIKLNCWRALMREHRAWLVRQGISLDSPAVRLFQERLRLSEKYMEFSLQAPSRHELWKMLHDEIRLYSPIWSPGYRLYKRALAAMAFVAGYERYSKLRGAYSNSVTARNLRERVAPRMRSESAHSARQPTSPPGAASANSSAGETLL